MAALTVATLVFTVALRTDSTFNRYEAWVSLADYLAFVGWAALEKRLQLLPTKRRHRTTFYCKTPP